MQVSTKRRGRSRLCRKSGFWIAAAVVAVLLMTVLAFGIASLKNTAEAAEVPKSDGETESAHSFAALYQDWERGKGSWESSLKHKYTEPVSVAKKCKIWNGGISRESWYVTTDEYNDRAGNLRTIFNFCAYNWAGAREWLVENDNAAWPYGSVRSDYLAKNWGKPVAMAIAACTLRECAGVPDQLQYMQRAGTLHGSFGTEVSNAYVFSCLEKRDYDQGYGLIGWTFDALDDFMAFCRASGLNPRSLETQLYFMAYQYYASEMWHQRYTYLFAYENVEPTLANIQTVARIHTSCVGMGSVPSVVYPSPTKAVEQILANWGNKTFPELVSAASGAYSFLYQCAYNQTPTGEELEGVAESSMYTGADGLNTLPEGMVDTTPAVSEGKTSEPVKIPIGTSSGGTAQKPNNTAKPENQGNPAEGTPSGGESVTEPTEPADSPVTEQPSTGGEENTTPTQDEIYTVTGPNILE